MKKLKKSFSLRKQSKHENSESSPTGSLHFRMRPTTANCLKIAIDHLDEQHLGVEGLYRMQGFGPDESGLTNAIKDGKQAQVQLLLQSIESPHSITGAVKQVLQQHEPLLTYSLRNRFEAEVTGQGQEEEEEEHQPPPPASKAVAPGLMWGCFPGGGQNRAKSGRQVLTTARLSPRKRSTLPELYAQLPPLTQHLMRDVLLHLKKVASSPDTKMDRDGLALTVGLWLVGKTEDVERTRVSGEVFKAMFDIFPSPLLDEAAPDLREGLNGGSSRPPQDQALSPQAAASEQVHPNEDGGGGGAARNFKETNTAFSVLMQILCCRHNFDAQFENKLKTAEEGKKTKASNAKQKTKATKAKTNTKAIIAKKKTKS